MRGMSIGGLRRGFYFWIEGARRRRHVKWSCHHLQNPTGVIKIVVSLETYLVLPCRLSLLKLLAYVGTTVNGSRLGFVRTLSKESSSSSITPGPGKIFLFEWMRRISSFLYGGYFIPAVVLTGFVFTGDEDDSDAEEYSVDGASSFIESTHNFTSIVTAPIISPSLNGGSDLDDTHSMLIL